MRVYESISQIKPMVEVLNNYIVYRTWQGGRQLWCVGFGMQKGVNYVCTACDKDTAIHIATLLDMATTAKKLIKTANLWSDENG